MQQRQIVDQTLHQASSIRPTCNPRPLHTQVLSTTHNNATGSLTGLHARQRGSVSVKLGNGILGNSRPASSDKRDRDVSCAAHSAIPPARGLYDPSNDKDACGVGFVAQLSKGASRAVVTDALKMLARMAHRGACGCEENTGMSGSTAALVPSRAHLWCD